MTTVLPMRNPGPGVVGGKGEGAEVGPPARGLLVKGITSCLLSRMRSAIAFWVLPTVWVCPGGLSVRMGLFFCDKTAK